MLSHFVPGCCSSCYTRSNTQKPDQGTRSDGKTKQTGIDLMAARYGSTRDGIWAFRLLEWAEKLRNVVDYLENIAKRQAKETADLLEFSEDSHPAKDSLALQLRAFASDQRATRSSNKTYGKGGAGPKLWLRYRDRVHVGAQEHRGPRSCPVVAYSEGRRRGVRWLPVRAVEERGHGHVGVLQVRGLQ